MLEIKTKLALTPEQIASVKEAVKEHNANSLDNVEYIEVKKETEDSAAEIIYKLASVPAMERIRRVTGYLSPVNRWNDAKRAELADRVKHA